MDASKRAVRVARLRGLKEAWCMSARQVSREIGLFDTIILFGNNFGMFGTPERGSKVLANWAQKSRPKARILAESTTPYCGGAPAINRHYHQKNKANGLMPGQIRFAYPVSQSGRSVVRLAVCLPPGTASTRALHGLPRADDLRGSTERIVCRSPQEIGPKTLWPGLAGSTSPLSVASACQRST